MAIFGFVGAAAAASVLCHLRCPDCRLEFDGCAAMRRHWEDKERVCLRAAIWHVRVTPRAGTEADMMTRRPASQKYEICKDVMMGTQLMSLLLVCLSLREHNFLKLAVSRCGAPIG